MHLAIVAWLIAITQFQPAPVNALQPQIGGQSSEMVAYGGNSYGPRINMRSPLSGSVLVAQAIRSGRVRLPFVLSPYIRPFALTCSPVPCVTPNVQASNGGQPINETPIATNPLKAAQLLTGGNDYNCPSLQGFFASSNKGSTWNHTCMNTVAGTSGSGDPAVGYDTNNIAYIAGIDSVSGTVAEIVFEKSSNNGVTWSAPAVAVSGISPYTFTDKEWMQIDDGAASPRKNAIYISTTEFDPSSNSIIAVAHSTNGGGSWTNVQVDAAAFPVVDQFSDLAIGKDGTLYLSWQKCSATGPTGDCGGTKAMMMFSKSLDGGVTWTVPVVMAKPNLAPDSCGAFYGCLPNTSERVSNIPAMDIDASSGTFSNRLYAIMYNYTGNKLQVITVRSKNGGATWHSPVIVDPAAINDEFFPWLTTGSTGTVGVTWLDRRLDPSNLKYDAFASTSTNGGVSFTASVRLSSVSSNPLNDGFGGGFMGDYTGNIWDGVTLFASWTDTRTGVAQDEVGGYKL